MDAIPLFLNDASYPSPSEERQIEEEILQLLRTIKSVKALDRPIVIGAALSMSEVPFSSAYHVLANFARIDREWWRFVRSLDQRVPFSLVPQCIPPDGGVHLVSGEAQAPLWVLSNKSFLLSFPIHSELKRPAVSVEVCECLDEVHQPVSRECRNLSDPSHVETWKDALLDFSYIEAASSTVFEAVDYRLKMYLHDHDPPHIHVYQSADRRKCVGRVRFDHVEVMEDKGFAGSVRKDVLALLEAKQEEFLRAWTRCRAGSLPNRIEAI